MRIQLSCDSKPLPIRFHRQLGEDNVSSGVTMKETIEAIQSAFSERLKNRFLGSFVVSWLVINWEIWATMLFGDGEFAQRISSIKRMFGVWQGVVAPLVSTAVFLGATPWINYAVELLQRKPNQLRKKGRIEEQKETERDRLELEELKAKRAALNEARSQAGSWITDYLKEHESEIDRGVEEQIASFISTLTEGKIPTYQKNARDIGEALVELEANIAEYQERLRGTAGKEARLIEWKLRFASAISAVRSAYLNANPGRKGSTYFTTSATQMKDFFAQLGRNDGYRDGLSKLEDTLTLWLPFTGVFRDGVKADDSPQTFEMLRRTAVEVIDDAVRPPDVQ